MTKPRTEWGPLRSGLRSSPVLDLVDKAEIAVRCRVSLRLVVRMHKFGILPTSDLQFEGHWLWDRIETWARMPGRTLRDVPHPARLRAILGRSDKVKVHPRREDSYTRALIPLYRTQGRPVQNNAQPLLHGSREAS